MSEVAKQSGTKAISTFLNNEKTIAILLKTIFDFFNFATTIGLYIFEYISFLFNVVL